LWIWGALRKLMLMIAQLVFNGTFGTNRLYRTTGVKNILYRARCKHSIKNNTLSQKDKKVLFDLVSVELISLTQIGVLTEVLLANHLASTDNLTNKTNTEKNTLLTKDKTVQETPKKNPG